MFNPRDRHWTVPDLAAAVNLSRDTIRRLFSDEPGVIRIYKPKRNLRRHAMLLIPESVVERVFANLQSDRPSELRRVGMAEAKCLGALSSLRLILFEVGLTICFCWWLFQHVCHEFH
jgi:hypothetical protein